MSKIVDLKQYKKSKEAVLVVNGKTGKITGPNGVVVDNHPQTAQMLYTNLLFSLKRLKDLVAKLKEDIKK